MTKLAVCLIAKDEGRYLLEWMAYNLMLGFDEILVYDNDSVDGSRQLVEQAGDVDRRIRYIPWPDAPGRSPQITAYNHALGNTDADWIAFIDADEFIVLHEHDTIGDFLSEFNDSRGPCACTGDCSDLQATRPTPMTSSCAASPTVPENTTITSRPSPAGRAWPKCALIPDD